MERILIIDDDIDICKLLERFLTRNGHNVVSFTNGKKAIEYLKANFVNIIFCDFRLPDMDGKELLGKIKELDEDAQVIIITGYSSIKTAVDVIKHGAFDYITKPLVPEEILLLVENAVKNRNLKIAQKKNASSLKDNISDDINNKNRVVTKHEDYVVGKSKEAEKLYHQVKLVAPTNYSVIIYGESGTGKESVAYNIHSLSPRRNKPFVAVDCGSLTKELAGSELFGHEKGSFTGAEQCKIGQFELANGGTIFLDEISNLPYDVQVSLLRAIQERKIRRLGSQKEINIDVRIIVASNEKLNEATSKGKFREDLFHRFNEFSINLPSLRERNKDIMLFAKFFLEKVNEELGREIEGFSANVEQVFMNYAWPGNLREMNNVIKRAALLTNQSTISHEVLPQEIIFQSKSNLTVERNETNPLFKGIPELKSAVIQAEYDKILEVLRKVNFNKSKAAVLLNIDRKTLYNKMKTFNLVMQNSI